MRTEDAKRIDHQTGLFFKTLDGDTETNLAKKTLSSFDSPPNRLQYHSHNLPGDDSDKIARIKVNQDFHHLMKDHHEPTPNKNTS